MKKSWKSDEITYTTKHFIKQPNVFRPVSYIIWLAFFLLVAYACGKKNHDHSVHGESTAWQCPMKCEGEKTYPQPGSCPVCKMDLKPVEMATIHDHTDLHNDTVTVVYICPMHPEIVRNEPGSCPICHMEMVKEETGLPATQQNAASVSGLEFLLKPTYEYVLSSVKTVHPERKTLATDIETPGYLAYDARRVQVIAARFGGRIERLYIKYLFQPVLKGQRILDIYSPEIATAQQDLIFLLENDGANTVLLENARRRLSLLGLTAEQITETEKSKKPMLSLPVFSPYEGLVFEKPLPTQYLSNEDMSGYMPSGSGSSNSVSNLAATEGLSLREGMYLQKGQRIFSLQSIAIVWAVLEIYPSDVSFIKVGQSVSIRVEPFEKPILGKINYIEPQFGTGSKNLSARVYIENPGGKLKPGALLKATVRAGSRAGLWIPKTAVLDLGRHRVVFLKKDSVFQSRKIDLGCISDGWLQVRSGISETDEIASDARFLMDSESFVKYN
jgi:Cu(I)/Ag(I) efflux system membrane fusion protein